MIQHLEGCCLSLLISRNSGTLANVTFIVLADIFTVCVRSGKCGLTMMYDKDETAKP